MQGSRGKGYASLRLVEIKGALRYGSSSPAGSHPVVSYDTRGARQAFFESVEEASDVKTCERRRKEGLLLCFCCQMSPSSGGNAPNQDSVNGLSQITAGLSIFFLLQQFLLYLYYLLCHNDTEPITQAAGVVCHHFF